MRALFLLIFLTTQANAQPDPCAPPPTVVDVPLSLPGPAPLSRGARVKLAIPVVIPTPPDPACREDDLPADVLRGAPAPRGLLRGDDLVDPLTGRPRGRVTIGP